MKSLEICSWQHLRSSNSRGSTSTTPYLLVNLIGKDGKTKEVAKAQMHLVGGLFEEKPIPPLYACVQVEHYFYVYLTFEMFSEDSLIAESDKNERGGAP